MDNVIIAIVVILILGLAAWYVIKAKRSGKKCIGCPDGCACDQGACHGCSGCGQK